MSQTEAELVAEMRSYLQRSFPGHEVREEWDRSRDVLEIRIRRPGSSSTLLVEIPSEVFPHLSDRDLRRSLDEWNLERVLREHFRVLVTPRGLEPLPWKQLAAEKDIVEETSEESFPASDSPGHSAISRGTPR